MSTISSYRSRNSSGTHTTMYSPDVTYEYSANGQVYQSKQISMGGIGGASSPDWATSAAAKYPIDSTVQVFYNPAKPEEAVLEHSGGGINLILVVILGIVESILIFILAIGLKGGLG
jgi:hypothetical protein